VGTGQSCPWVGLGWVKQNGPVDNSGTGGNRFAENEGVMPGMKE